DRERERKEEHACAAELNKAGVRFAFATHAVTGDRPHEKFASNLRLAIKAGLPSQAALKALTESAANILGVANQLGTIEKGKAAHLVVTDGDFNEDKTKVKFVFSDGIKFDPTIDTRREPRTDV